MIYGLLNQGSGIGNQLHRYVATRVRALEMGVDWRMFYNPDNSGKQEGFKAKDFIKFDESKLLDITKRQKEYKMWTEKKVVENGIDIRSYDPNFNFTPDNAIIEGEFQDERYWQDHEKEVGEWLMVEPLDMPENLCIIGFRGGEFSVYPDLFLTKEYWDTAIDLMKETVPNVEFEVHTDDMELAKKCFPDYKVISNPEINWRSMRYAKYAIIANSSFFILPRWLSRNFTVAPWCWGRRNIKTWSMNQNYYKRFQYI